MLKNLPCCRKWYYRRLPVWDLDDLKSSNANKILLSSENRALRSGISVFLRWVLSLGQEAHTFIGIEMRWRGISLVCNVLWVWFIFNFFFFLAYSFEIIFWNISSILCRVVRERETWFCVKMLGYFFGDQVYVLVLFGKSGERVSFLGLVSLFCFCLKNK